MFRVFVISVLAMTALIPPVRAQDRKQNWKHCRDANPDIQIAGCTAVIQSGNDKPRNLAGAYFNRGIAYTAKAEYDPAIADYNQALLLVPAFSTDLIFLIRRGIAYEFKGDYAKAINDYSLAIVLQPLSADAFNDRGIAYDDKGEYDRGIQDLNEAIRLRPDFAYAFTNRGVAYIKKGDYPRGLQDYDWSIRLMPNYYPSFECRCFARALIGQFDQALTDCNRALSLKPNYTDAIGTRGFAYLRMGKYDLAIADYDVALGTDVNNKSPSWHKRFATWMYERGLAKEKKGDAAGAVSDIAAAKGLDADVADENAKWDGPAATAGK